MARACRSLLSRARALTKMTGEAGAQSAQHGKARSAMHFLESALSSLQPSTGLRLDEMRAGGSASMVHSVADHLIDGLAQREPSQADIYKSGTKPTFQGQSPAITVPETLGFLASHQKTGVLEVTSLSETVVIGLRDGAVIHASSDNTPAGLRLGEILLAKKAIEERALYAVLAKANTMRNLKLGELLEREGKVPREMLRAALEYQIQQLFNRMFELHDAHFAFYERDRANVDGMLALNVTRLLLGSATNADGRPADVQTTEALQSLDSLDALDTPEAA
ncbi:MAG: DUF4388 domain-containing protein [Planctomycetota bacterium]|nr:MAG: DUF4388 domain-containing protein [Planctomycetota bacterium]